MLLIIYTQVGDMNKSAAQELLETLIPKTKSKIRDPSPKRVSVASQEFISPICYTSPTYLLH